MMIQVVSDKIAKYATPATVAILAFLAYDYYYEFLQSESSPLVQARIQLDMRKQENGQIAAKVKKAKEFYATLDQKRAELRTLALQLEELKVSLSEDVDIPSFLRAIVLEANKVGLQVLGLRPAETKKSEFYEEQTYDLGFRAVFVQLVVFLERLSKLERIVRPDSYTMRPVSSTVAPYVELEGMIRLKTYRYLATKADEIIKGLPAEGAASGAPAPTASPVPSPSPGTPAAAAAPGAKK